MQAVGQKPPIDSTTFNKWPRLLQSAICNNGEYMYFVVHNPSINQDSLHIRSTNGNWQEDYSSALYPSFTRDSRKMTFQRKDTIFLMGLENKKVNYIADVEGTYSLFSSSIGSDLLIYRTKQRSGRLVINSLSSGEIKSYSSVEKFWFNDTSSTLLLLVKDSAKSIYHLEKVALSLQSLEDVWQGPKIEDLAFAADGTQVAFLTSNEKGKESLWYYYVQKKKVIPLLNDSSRAIDSSLKIASIFGISVGNSKVYLTLKKETTSKYIPPPGVDIYRYNDPKLQSQQLFDLTYRLPRQTFKAVVDISTGKFLRIEYENDEIIHLNQSSLPDNWVLLVTNGVGDITNEWYWNKHALSNMYLLSLKDGRKQLLSESTNRERAFYFYLSPKETFVLYFNFESSNYYTLNIETGDRKIVTRKMNWTNRSPDVWPAYKPFPIGVGGFTTDGKYALIYDQYDIYKVNLAAQQDQVSLTKSYGRNHHIVFRLPIPLGNYSPNEKIILDAFNENSKEKGYYNISLNNSNTLDSLSMLSAAINKRPIKAKDASAYLVELEDSRSHPNVFFSSDLRSFTPLSSIYPETKYNWLTSELVTWHLSNKEAYQGVLYKPENFDAHKKYPLLFVYYEQKSNQLHEFLEPQANGGEINIPFFVSNGYLVFTPDVHYKVGSPGESAFVCIVSAVDLLSKRPYVDARKIGLQGMSFGGFETNYIITHTARFAAAMSNSGMTDFVSAYGSIVGNGTSRQRQYEVYRDRIGATLWQNPGLYIKNSPIFRANLVQTPLLLIANNEDPDVPHEQGVELFTALRRLGKKVWMLQYDKMGHGVWGNAAKDFSVRVFQFFNYYLKDELPPKWMTCGIPAELKGIDNGFQLDPSGSIP